MSIEQLKADIADCEASISKNQELLCEIREKITEIAKPFTREKLQEFVEREVKEQSEHTKSLGINTLKEMKGKLSELLDNSDNLTFAKFENDGYWSHVNYKCEDKNGVVMSLINKRAVEDKFTSAFQELFGNAGKILNEYGYIKVGNDYNNHSSNWVSISGSGGKIRYAYGISYFKSDLENLIEQYCKILGDVHTYMVSLRNLKKQLSEQEAVSLWEQI